MRWISLLKRAFISVPESIQNSDKEYEYLLMGRFLKENASNPTETLTKP
jgi:hypothetical protein